MTTSAAGQGDTEGTLLAVLLQTSYDPSWSDTHPPLTLLIVYGESLVPFCSISIDVLPKADTPGQVPSRPSA